MLCSARVSTLVAAVNMQTERIAVVGAGAVGCYFGGMLARAGVRDRVLRERVEGHRRVLVSTRRAFGRSILLQLGVLIGLRLEHRGALDRRQGVGEHRGEPSLVFGGVTHLEDRRDRV